jgi:NADH-quinone oxidoreductase subunit M
MSGFPWLSCLIFTPLLGAVIVSFMPARRADLARGFTQGLSFLCLALVLGISGAFVPNGGLQAIERHAWISALGAEYFLGIDGLGLVSILLTAIITPFALFAWRPPEAGAKIYYALFLALESGLFGAFTAFNFFHWFFFWELSLIPAFFLIKLWGGPQRARASMQFFVYTLFGSVALLLAFQVIFLATGTFDFIRLAELGRTGALTRALTTKLGIGEIAAQTMPLLAFLGVFLGLAVKVPLGPFHAWLPPAYAEAPASVSMMLTGVMSKMGVYGFLRILLPLFPDQLRQWQTPLLCLAIGTIVFSAWTAMAQKDLKRIIAYSSINHLGYCLLAVFVVVQAEGAAEHKQAALDGAIFQMFNHGLSASALFCFVGWLEQRGHGLRGLDDFGGLRKIAPVFTGLMGIALFSSLGLPGLNGFIGEFLIFKGVLALQGWAAALSAFGLLLTALFLLTILQRVFSGPLPDKWAKLPDLTTAERWIAAPIIALMFVIGVYPQVLMGIINPTVGFWVTTMP